MVLGKESVRSFTMTDFVNGFNPYMDSIFSDVFLIFKVKPEPGTGHFYDCPVGLLELAFRGHSRTAHRHRCRLQEEKARLLR